MAQKYSPTIVKNGLVLALDAADKNSYNVPTSVEVLVVAGGGGGGMDMGGGGGGGGVVYNSKYNVSKGDSITVTVGAGGWGAPAGSGGYRGDGAGPQPSSHQFTISATNGGNSVFGTITALGGGFGASSYYGYSPNSGIGGSGGSGGGCSAYTHGGERYVDTNGTPGQGYPGGNSGNPSSGGDDHYSGGGGGAGGRGTSGPNHTGPNGTRADGGPGVRYPQMSPYYFAGGGGGSGYSSTEGGNGGLGGGGGGAAGGNGNTVGYGDTNGINAGGNGGLGNNQPGGNAGANTGGGGGGGSHYNSNNKGGDGGSGIVIVRYPGPQAATGGTVETKAGYTYHTFTSSGTFAVGNSTTWRDISGNGNNFTILTSAYNSSGPKYMDFNGSYGSAKNSSDISLSDSSGVTYVVWTRPKTSTAEWRTLTRSYVSDHHVIIESGGYLIGTYDNDSAGFLSSGLSQTSLPNWGTNNWICMYWRWQASSPYYELSYNDTPGTIRGSITNSNARYNRGFGSIGAYHNGSTDPSNSSQYWGDIASFLCYNRRLTNDELLQIYNSTKTRFGL
jgi:hypothetical protein